MQVGQAWLIYIIAVIIAYFVFTLWPGLCNPVRWLLAFIVGLIVFLIIAPSIVQITPSDIAWYKTLVVVAYGATILLALWAVLSYYPTGEDSSGAHDKCKVDQVYACEGGICELMSEQLKCPQGRAVFVHK